jgi:hypothetical protein
MVAVFAAYFDESYNHPNPKRANEPLVYTVACWLSTVEKWRKFGKRWKRILQDSELEFFHMTDYESRKAAPYCDWSQEKHLQVLQELLRAIRDYRIYGCAIVVNCAAWDEVFKNDQRLRNIFGKNYYSFDVSIAIRTLNEWCDTLGYQGQIKYIFAELAKQGSVLDPLFKMLNTHADFRTQYRMSGMWHKGLMKRVVQLQAADVIAYEVNKRAANHMSPDKNYLRRSMASLDLNENFEPLYFGHSEIRKWINVILKTKPLGSSKGRS